MTLAAEKELELIGFQRVGRSRSCIGATMAEKKQPRRWPRRWVQGVKTVSTFPPPGTFTRDAETIARIMASKKVSPNGIGSGIRMIQYFINRGGKNLSAERKRELEKAKQILQAKARKQR